MKTFVCCFVLAFISCRSSRLDDETVARVNSHSISTKTFLARYARVQNLTTKQEVLNEMIGDQLLFEAAIKDGLEHADSLKQAIARNYLQKSLGTAYTDPTPQQTQEMYEKKKGELEQVRVSHILLQDSSQADALLKKIRKEGKKVDFAKYAREHSQDSLTKDRGGDLLFMTQKSGDKEWVDAAFSLKELGEVSDVVRTSKGYHIFQLTAQLRGIEFFQPQIRALLVQKQEKDKAAQLIARLKKNASIKINEKLIEGQTAVPK